jgi:uncharacterized protein YndB with AHSA1/START domain
MDDAYTATTSVVIKAPAARVWEALTDPEMIQQYMFGAEVTSDWKAGSPITYRGEWNGKPFEDKGHILAAEPGRRLVTTHWSPLSGTPDSPENYHTVRYELSENDGETELILTQDNNASEEEKQESEKNWTAMLVGLKRLLEG